METLSRHALALVDFSDERSILAYAKRLEGHTFREVLELGIAPENVASALDRYAAAPFKGGVGTLLEERYFGYRANSNPEPDFADAGVELKTTCFDRKTDGSVRAGERLVLTMIAYDQSIEAALLESHLWRKAGRILLIYYERDRAIERYDQRVTDVALFTPPPVDLAIIEQDYRTIQGYVTAGRADELSESLTSYLGACTKGATSAKSMRDQKAYAPGRLARGRAWCYKNSYMNAVLHDYILGDSGLESIVKDPALLDGTTFEDLVIGRIDAFKGMEDAEIASALGLESGPANKSFWRMIAFRLLGLSGEGASEFRKANVEVRTVRIEKRGVVRESFPLAPFRFTELASEEDWEQTDLYCHFDEKRFLFVVFERSDTAYRLKGARFWAMPRADLEGPLRDCWLAARARVRDGVTFTKKYRKNGTYTIANDLPGMADSPVAHVRPHASRAAYRLKDGTEIGDVAKDGDRLPDGQWMTKQSFWLNSSYIYEIARTV